MTSPFASLDFDGFSLASGTSSLALDGQDYPLLWTAATPDTWTASAPKAEVTLARTAVDGRVTYKPHVELARAVHNLAFTLLKTDVACTHVLSHGPRMGSCSLFPLPVDKPTEFASWHVTVFTNGKRQLLVSIPFDMPHFTSVQGSISGDTVACRIVSEAREFDGLALNLPEVSFECGNAYQLLYDYADRQADAKKDFPDEPARGWNSWDYYRYNITEDEVLSNAEFIAKDPVLGKYVTRIIIDDGWQYCYGEWEPNHYFHSGMAKLAAEIKKLGFEPGLWLAPASVEPQAHIATWDADMLAMSPGGQPCLAFECMRRKGFLLDPTVEKSRKWLTELFDRYCQYGYTYFKLDFLFQLFYAPRYHDATVPRGKVMQKLMAAVHDGVKGRAAILGCNYPFACGNAFVDSVRVGSDIHARWNGVPLNAVHVSTRFWANKKLWLNDPDFAVCRGPETSDDPDIARLQPSYVFVTPDDAFRPECHYPLATATRRELQVLLSVNLMSGGAVNLSDKMPLLNEAGLDLARRTVAAESGQAAIPLDLFTSATPSLWLQQLRHGRHRLLAVNWSDTEKTVSLAPAGSLPATARDFWTDDIVTVAPVVELPPHSCRLLEY